MPAPHNRRVEASLRCTQFQAPRGNGALLALRDQTLEVDGTGSHFLSRCSEAAIAQSEHWAIIARQ
jgi:hypothetical protein